VKHFIFLFFLLLAFPGVSQTPSEEDEVVIVSPEPTDTSSVIKNTDMDDEKNALYSAILPGWGQYRNGQYISKRYMDCRHYICICRKLD